MVKKKKKYQKEKRPELLYTELSTDKDLDYGKWGLRGYNPDDLVGKKGLEIYEKMRKDDTIHSAISTKKYGRMATPWSIVPVSEDAFDMGVANFVKEQLIGLKGTLEGTIFNMLTALDYGFSVSEIVYEPVIKGEWTGKIGLKKIATRNPINYDFKVDDHGNLYPKGIMYQQEEYPTNRFVIYSYNKEFSNWYGNSDLRTCYRSWWSKEIIIRFYNIYLERFGMPTVKAKYPKGMGEDQVKKLRAVMDNIQAKYSITLPTDVEVDLLESGKSGDVGFRQAVEMHNKFMTRAILLPDLVGYTTSEGGSYALGKKQFDLFLWVLKKLGRDIEEDIMAEQIIKKLVDLNFNVNKYPKFKFEALTEEDTEAKARIVRLGVDGGFINPTENWVRPYLNLPKPDSDVVLGMPQLQRGAPIGARVGGGAPALGKKGQPSAERGVPREDLWVSGVSEYDLEIDGKKESYPDFDTLYSRVQSLKKHGLSGDTKIKVYERK